MKHTTRIGGADLNTNPYYNDLNWVGKSNLIFSKNNSFQCADWVFERCQEDVEKRITHFTSQKEKPVDNPIFEVGYPDAMFWAKETLWKFKLDNPKEGDIICYGSSWGNGHGHVRYIERIEDNFMYCSGANEGAKVKFNIKVPITKGGGVNATGLQGYISNPHFNEEKIDYKALYLEAQAKLDKIRGILNE